MTISLGTSEPLSDTNPRAVDDSIMPELRSLTVALTEYLAQRKMLEERRATCRTCLAVFIVSMGASAAITNSWIGHTAASMSAIRSVAPGGHGGTIAVRNSAYQRFKATRPGKIDARMRSPGAFL